MTDTRTIQSLAGLETLASMAPINSPVVVRLRRTQIEVGAPRNGRPGYRWVPAYIVVNPYTGNDIHPPVRRKEAYALARTFNPSRITVE